MDADKVRELIKTDTSHTIGALLRLYDFQTKDEQTTKSTHKKNEYGFNATDASILTDISKFYQKKGYLSDKQVRLIRSKLAKYAKQLAEVGFEPKESSKQPTQKSEPQKEEKKASFESDILIKVEFPFNFNTLEQVKKIQGRKFIPEEKYWTVPLTLINIEKLKELDFTFSKDLEEWHRKQTEGITNEFSVPGLNNTLFPFQKEAVSFIEAKDGRALVADEQGLGKTLESIAWFHLHGENVYPVVITCPATLKLNWKKEIETWTNLGSDVELLSGETPYHISKPIIIINYDILFNWYSNILYEMKPKLIIADEIHYCKNRGTGFKTVNGVKKKTVITQRSAALEAMAQSAKYFIGLTGTPILNRPRELFIPLKMIKPGLFPRFKSFADRYCNPTFNGFGWSFDGASNTIELNQVLTRECMLRRKKEDVLKDLPPKTKSIVPLETENMDEYKEAENDFINYLKETEPEKVKKAQRAKTLTQLQYLRRLAIKGKIDNAIKWIENFIENEKLVIFVRHTETVDLLMNKFKDIAVEIDGRTSKKKREEHIKQFQNNDDINLFVGMLDNQGSPAGVGITLTASSNVCFLEYPWQPGIYNQASDRCHRLGQKDNVTIWNLIASNTIEENMVKLLEKKAKVASAVVDGDDSDTSGIFNDLIDDLTK